MMKTSLQSARPEPRDAGLFTALSVRRIGAKRRTTGREAAIIAGFKAHMFLLSTACAALPTG
jgi:hypothetical protein